MMSLTTLVALALISCALSQQHGYHPVQYFYLNPNNAASLEPAQYPVQPAQPRQTGGLEEDEELEASQFHSQDGDGRFAFGYSMPDQVRIESRNIDGSVRGSYSYLDPTGKTIKVQYWDDGSGFHTAGNNLPTDLPQPVQDTPEVQAARAHHFRLYEEALRIAAAAKHSPGLERQQSIASGDAEDGIVVESDSHTPVDEKGVELTRYPKLQIPQNLFDPAQIHDAKLEAVIVENPEILGPSFDGNSVRSGKSGEYYQGSNTDQLRTTVNVISHPRKGFSYSFSYPIQPMPIEHQPGSIYPGSQYGYIGPRASKGLEKVMYPMYEQKQNFEHQKVIPFSYTFPVPASREGSSPYQHGVQDDTIIQGGEAHSGGEHQAEQIKPSARKGFSYSFSYPVKAKPMYNTQYGSQYGYKAMRYVRSTDGIKMADKPAEKKDDVGTSRSGSTYIEVKPVLEYETQGVQQGFAPETDELKSLFARMGNNPIGLSQKAVDHGSIPIAAVHDAQVAPHQLGTFKNHQLAPVFYGSFTKKNTNHDGRGDIMSGLTKIPPVSVSEKAVYFGAIPVAAVHDQQVAPYQRDGLRDHQTLPLYIEHIAY